MLRRLILFLSLALLIGLPAVSAGPRLDAPRHTWAQTLGGSYNDEAWTIQPEADGGCIVGGLTWSFGRGEMDLLLIRLAADGSVVWRRTYGGPGSEAADLVTVLDDGYIVTGFTSSYGAGDRDVWVLRLDRQGNILWERTYGGEGEDVAVSVLPRPEGGFILAGDTESFGAGSDDLWLLAIDANGDIEWEKTYGGPEYDASSADPLVVTSDGGYFCVGQTVSFGAGGGDVWMLRLDSQGEVLWARTLGHRGWDEAHAACATSDGAYVVNAFSNSFGEGGTDVWLIKVDDDGDILWQRSYGGVQDETAWSVWPTDNGGCAFAGTTKSWSAGGRDAWIVAVDAEGDIVWQRTLGGLRDDGAESLRTTADGGFLVTGYTRSYGYGYDDVLALTLDGQGLISGCDLLQSSSCVPQDTALAPASSPVTATLSSAIVMTSTCSTTSPNLHSEMLCAHDHPWDVALLLPLVWAP